MLLTFLSTNQARIVETLYERLRQTVQEADQFAPHGIRDNIAKGAAAFAAALQAEDPMVLDRFIADLIAPRTVEEYPIGHRETAGHALDTTLVEILQRVKLLSDLD